jgi:hypothetical protein
MNLLVTGNCKPEFIVPWVKHMTNSDNNHSISLLNLESSNREYFEEEKKYFSDILDTNSINFNIKNKLKTSIRFFKKKGFFHFIKIKSIKEIKNEIVEDYKRLRVKEWYKEILNKVDIIFIHYLIPKNFEVIPHITNQKLILCFWGSDLMQSSTEIEWITNKKFLNKADIITLQTESLKFICCTKYGFNLKGKINVVPFIPDPEIYRLLDEKSKNESKNELSKLYGGKVDKLWISCGYRPIPMVQQAEIISELNKLPKKIKGDLCLVLTMNYSTNDEEYINQILAKSKGSGIEYIVIDKYLSINQVASLRKAIDIFIHFPESDALSGTLLEHLYGGAKVITNSALPYGVLRKYNIDYDEVFNFKEINPILEKHIKNKSIQNKNNSALIKLFIDEEINTNSWMNLISD